MKRLTELRQRLEGWRVCSRHDLFARLCRQTWGYRVFVWEGRTFTSPPNSMGTVSEKRGRRWRKLKRHRSLKKNNRMFGLGNKIALQEVSEATSGLSARITFGTTRRISGFARKNQYVVETSPNGCRDGVCS